MFSQFRRLCKRWKYEPLGLLPSDQPPSRNKKSTRPRALIIGLALTIGVVIVVCSARSTLFRRPYNPLDDYQDINPLPVTIGQAAEPSPSSRRAVVSSLYSDGYALSVAVLGHSARSANVTARLLLPYLEEKVSKTALCIARAAGWEPYPVALIPPPHGTDGLFSRFVDQYTKLRIWTLDEKGIDSAVYLDADTLVRRNFDELFDSPFTFAAVPDVYTGHRGFELTFNAGVLAFRPSSKVFGDMLQQAKNAEYPQNEAEQGFLNLYFGGTVMRLPYIYNANLAIKVRSPALWEHLVDEMRIVHYSLVKPFLRDWEALDVLLMPEEMEEVLETSGEREGGLFREEATWWKDAYERMMLKEGHAVRRCYLLSE
ncbi:glycosyltransferase family 8 protein [Mycena galericulata]|nr:glycosyltransferase family 8 protein [Mycena galericulata]